MEEQKRRICGVNRVFLFAVLISVIVPFLPLSFLADKPVLQIIFSQVIFAIPAIIYMITKKMPYAETVRFKKMKGSDMLLSILFGILLQPAITLINALSMVFAENVIGNSMYELTKGTPFLGGVFLMAVLPAVMEESVYRGVFYTEYSKVHPLKAALLSGLLFGILHGNINQFCYAAVMGIIFALLIEATGSILSTMLVHFWFNASSVVLMYIYPKMYEVAKAYYEMYVEYGNNSMAELLKTTFGDMTLTPEVWMDQAMNSSADLQLTVETVFTLYGPRALFMGVFAVLVYRLLAKRNGNWERILACFGRKSSVAVQKAEEGQETEIVQEAVTVQNTEISDASVKVRLITPALAVAVILGVAYMIFYEMLLRMMV